MSIPWGIVGGVVGVVGIAGITAGIAYLVPGVAYAEAKSGADAESGKSTFFTLNEEGQYRSVMRGGEFHRPIMAYKGHTLGTKNIPLGLRGDGFDDLYVVPEDPSHPSLSYREESQDWMKGTALVGWMLNEHLYDYEFAWTSFKPGEMDNTPYPFKPHKARRINYIYVKPAVYGLHIKQVELAGGELNLPKSSLRETVGYHHDIWLVVTIQVSNPGRALHRIPDWLNATFSKLQPRIIQELAKHKPEEINTGSIRNLGEKAATSSLSFKLMKICEEVTNGYIATETKADGTQEGVQILGTEFEYGSMVLHAAVYSSDPSNPEDRKNLLANAEAELKGQAAFTEAQYKRKVAVEIATGEAEAIGKIRTATSRMTDRQLAMFQLDKWTRAVEVAATSKNAVINIGPPPTMASALQTADMVGKNRES